MPRSIHDILDHADDIPVEEYLLRRAVVARARSEQQLIATVVETS